MTWKNLFELHLTEREVELLCEASKAHKEAAKEDQNLELVDDWEVIQTKLECSLERLKGKPK